MTNQTYLTEDGKVRVRLIGERYARYPQGEVLDADGNVVGEATSYTYGGAAFAVHTLPFASNRAIRCPHVPGVHAASAWISVRKARVVAPYARIVQLDDAGGDRVGDHAMPCFGQPSSAQAMSFLAEAAMYSSNGIGFRPCE